MALLSCGHPSSINHLHLLIRFMSCSLLAFHPFTDTWLSFHPFRYVVAGQQPPPSKKSSGDSLLAMRTPSPPPLPPLHPPSPPLPLPLTGARLPACPLWCALTCSGLPRPPPPSSPSHLSLPASRSTGPRSAASWRTWRNTGWVGGEGAGRRGRVPRCHCGNSALLKLPIQQMADPTFFRSPPYSPAFSRFLSLQDPAIRGLASLSFASMARIDPSLVLHSHLPRLLALSLASDEASRQGPLLAVARLLPVLQESRQEAIAGRHHG